MSRLIDVSVPLDHHLPIWPGSCGLRVSQTMKLLEGGKANVTRLDCDIHTGTHVEVPWHVIESGKTIDKIPLTRFVGKAFVVVLERQDFISARDLEDLDIPKGVSRLLIKTKNSRLWKNFPGRFRRDYVALRADAARWIVRKRIRLVGIDYLSIQRFEDGPVTHKILLKAGVVILEGLNLTMARPGFYELMSFPIRLVGVEGAPVRAVLRPMGRKEYS